MKSTAQRILRGAAFILSAVIFPACAEAQVFEWANAAGGTGTDWGQAVAVDQAGNVYVTGRFSGVADFNPGPDTDTIVSAGNYDAFLAKYDAGGNYVWAINIGGPGTDYGNAIAVDLAGNVYVTGQFTRYGDFDPGPDTARLSAVGNYDIFLAKYDAGGSYLWARSMGGTEADFGLGIGLDTSGNVYISGYFNSPTADFDPGTPSATLTSAGAVDIFLARYDTAGNYAWAVNMGGNGNDQGLGLAVDKAGNTYITGQFYEPAEFDPGTGTAVITPAGGGVDAFLAKYNTNGGYEWAKSIGGAGTDAGVGVAVDTSGNVYITGQFDQAIDFNPGTTLTPVGIDVFLARYDSGGNCLWAGSMGGAGTEYSGAVTVDRRGYVFVTGYFNQAGDYDPGPGTATLTPGGGFDIFLARYDAAGNYVWAGSMGGAGSDYGMAVSAGSRGDVYIAGRFNDTADFDPGAGTVVRFPAGSYDAFILKLACEDTSSFYLADSVKCGESYTLNGEVYTVGGVYTQIRLNAAGCDSTITLDLTVYRMGLPRIAINGFTLSIAGMYASYQWIRNDTLIPGATDSSYIVTANGRYRVAVTDAGGCSDTSEVYPVNNVQVAGAGRPADIGIFPNPATGFLYITASEPVTLSLFTITGKLVRTGKNDTPLSLKGLAEGIYYLRIKNNSGQMLRNEKILLQSGR